MQINALLALKKKFSTTRSLKSKRPLSSISRYYGNEQYPKNHSLGHKYNAIH